MAPGSTAKLNAVVDTLVLLAAASASGLRLGGAGVLLATAVWTLLGLALRHYDALAYTGPRGRDAGTLSIMIMVLSTALLIGLRLASAPPAVAGDAALVPLMCWPVLMALRLLGFRRLSKREGARDQVLILGAGPLGRNTATDLTRAGGRAVLGQLCFGDEPHAGWRNVADLDDVLKGTPVDEVFIAGQPLRQAAEMQAAVRVCERLGMPFALPITGFRFDRARPLDAAIAADGYTHYVSLEPRQLERTAKRLFDIVAAGAAIIVLSPLLLTVGLLIKATSVGPVFFRQKRVGLHGRPFQMLKFRSMSVDAESQRAFLEAKNEQTGPVFKMKNDPRVTVVGRFIRKHSIDELPQLFDVLAGDMSVVGPRPPLPAEVAKYESWQWRRLSVRPGLTCIWQVSGRNQISFEEWMKLDMQYIDHWSLAADLQLILRTIPVVLAGRGAS
jgi:exopolysaccharide biosynthesis polyprenyl glycosylphosphotransferase